MFCIIGDLAYSPRNAGMCSEWVNYCYVQRLKPGTKHELNTAGNQWRDPLLHCNTGFLFSTGELTST